MGHIRETPDDKMDWKFYYSEGIPKDVSDAEWRRRIGNRGWEIIHGAIDNYPCSLCQEPGTKLFHGVHDVVNVHLGKPVMYPDDLSFLAVETARALKTLKKSSVTELAPVVRHLEAAPVVVRSV